MVAIGLALGAYVAEGVVCSVCRGTDCEVIYAKSGSVFYLGERRGKAE